MAIVSGSRVLTSDNVEHVALYDFQLRPVPGVVAVDDVPAGDTLNRQLQAYVQAGLWTLKTPSARGIPVRQPRDAAPAALAVVARVGNATAAPPPASAD